MDNCPSCKSSWIDQVNPELLYKREIGIDGGYMGIYDGLVAIRCPDCGEEFPVSSHPVHLEMFNKYKQLKET
jgi:predicted Zn-ribbon and HTH transcriptional regulator